MTRRRTNGARRSVCPLTGGLGLREAADAVTEIIRGNFPAGLARPALRALAAAGFTRLSQLAAMSDEQLLALHGFGPKALRLVRQAAAETHQR